MSVDAGQDSIVCEEQLSCPWAVLFTRLITPYKGVVNTEDDTCKVLRSFEEVTSTKYSVWKVQKRNFGHTAFHPHTQAYRVYWDQENVPFVSLNRKVLDCQHGKDRKVARKRKPDTDDQSELKDHDFRLKVNQFQEKKKFDCPAQVVMREIIRFPQYKVSRPSEWRLKERVKVLKSDFEGKESINFSRCFIVSLPDHTQHKNHLIGPSFVSHIISQEDEDGQPTLLRIPKNRRAEHSQFCDKWLTVPELKGWILPFQFDPAFVWCKFCRKKIRAHLTDMKIHSRAARHKRNMLRLKPVTPEAYMVLDPSVGSVVISFPPPSQLEDNKDSLSEVVARMEGTKQQKREGGHRSTGVGGSLGRVPLDWIYTYRATGELPADITQAPEEEQLQYTRALRQQARTFQYDAVTDTLWYIHPAKRASVQGWRRVLMTMGEVEQVLADLHPYDHKGISLGSKKMHMTLAQEFYWQDMRRDISDWVSSCSKCQELTLLPLPPPESQEQHPPLVVHQPFEVWGVEVVGPFTATTSRNTHVLLCTDLFSKWVLAEPMPGCSPEAAYRCLEKWIEEFCAPKKILTDQGISFDKRVNILLHERYGRQPITLEYHLQTTELDEHTSQVVRCDLQMLASERVDDWDLYLHRVVGPLRRTPHPSTQQVPLHVVTHLSSAQHQEVVEEEGGQAEEGEEEVEGQIMEEEVVVTTEVMEGGICQTYHTSYTPDAKREVIIEQVEPLWM